MVSVLPVSKNFIRILVIFNIFFVVTTETRHVFSVCLSSGYLIPETISINVLSF
jgi:hypothetical protein